VVALYAGTIGLVSGAEVIIDAAVKLGPASGVRILFVGEGQLLPKLEQRARDLGLGNVAFLPFQPRELLNDVQSAADVSLVTLLPGHGRTSMPSKVLGYLAAGRPVVAAVDTDSETARFLRRAGAGIVVPPGDPPALADAIVALRDDPERRRAMGRAGRVYLERHCSQDEVLGAYAEMFASFAT
jgi:colanic acid biosynthesis glycosyl transferase WcaI